MPSESKHPRTAVPSSLASHLSPRILRTARRIDPCRHLWHPFGAKPPVLQESEVKDPFVAANITKDQRKARLEALM